MKFHLGSQPYRIYINGQLLRLQQLGYLGAPEQVLRADISQELHLIEDYTILVEPISADEYGFDAYFLTADFPVQYICQEKHWGSWYIDSTYPTIDTPIDIYELDTYEMQEYNDQERGNYGFPEAEAVLIRRYGKYLGSIYVDVNNCWQFVYKEDLANE